MYLEQTNKMLQVKVADLIAAEKELDRLWHEYGMNFDKNLEDQILKRIRNDYTAGYTIGIIGSSEYCLQYAKVTELRIDLAKFVISTRQNVETEIYFVNPKIPDYWRNNT